MVVSALMQLAIAAPVGALFGAAYGTSIRIGYEIIFPALFGNKATPQSVDATLQKMTETFTGVGGLEAHKFGVTQGLKNALKAIDADPELQDLIKKNSYLDTQTPTPTKFGGSTQETASEQSLSFLSDLARKISIPLDILTTIFYDNKKKLETEEQIFLSEFELKADFTTVYSQTDKTFLSDWHNGRFENKSSIVQKLAQYRFKSTSAPTTKINTFITGYKPRPAELYWFQQHLKPNQSLRNQRKAINWIQTNSSMTKYASWAMGNPEISTPHTKSIVRGQDTKKIITSKPRTFANRKLELIYLIQQNSKSIPINMQTKRNPARYKKVKKQNAQRLVLYYRYTKELANINRPIVKKRSNKPKRRGRR